MKPRLLLLFAALAAIILPSCSVSENTPVHAAAGAYGGPAMQSYMLSRNTETRNRFWD